MATGDKRKPADPRLPSSRCAQCGHLLDPLLPDCRHCGAPVPDPEEPSAAADPFQDVGPQKPPPRRKPRLFPIGLLVTLAVYGLLAREYIRREYYQSPQFQAAVRLRQAQELLGRDDGRTARREDLLEALRLSVDAAGILPDNAWAHRRAEIIAARMSERRVDVPDAIRRKMDMLGAKWRRMQDDRTWELPVTARDLWDVDAVIRAPRTAVNVAIGVGFVIVLVWASMVYQDRLRRRAAEDQKRTELKEDLRDLNLHRRRIKTKP